MDWKKLQAKLSKKTHRQIKTLAEKSGVPYSTLYKLARGYHGNPRADVVDKITGAL